MSDMCFFFTFGCGAAVGVLIGMLLGAHCTFTEMEYEESIKKTESSITNINRELKVRPKLRIVK